MLARVMYTGIAIPDWRQGFIRATQIGCLAALFALLIAFILSRIIPEGPGSFAASELFQRGSTTVVLLVALIWAPCFETLVGQMLPVGFVRLFSRADVPAVLCSGLVFGLGHMAGGGGVMQGVFTAMIGSILASVYVANIAFGAFRASILTAWTHCVHNALVLTAAMSLS
jgi:membrane protease YdiL (CAAX protease family)